MGKKMKAKNKNAPAAFVIPSRYVLCKYWLSLVRDAKTLHKYTHILATSM